jgi:CheY-like chemotaxis protein
VSVTLEFPAEADLAPAPSDPGEPLTVLVVDDAPMDRRLAGRLVEKAFPVKVSYAADGVEAMEHLSRSLPSVVLTDLQMPNMNGLELVQEIRREYPQVPVILMTGKGSEDIAILALQYGATSYLPKRNLAQNIAGTIQQVLQAAKVDRRHQKLLESLTDVEYRFRLESDASMVPLLVSHLQENLSRMGLCDQTGRIRMGIALEESLLNGIYHGNLELSSSLRESGDGTFERMAQERRHLAPYRERRLHVLARMSGTEAVFVIRDEGPGFDPLKIPDPTDPESLERASGRGLLLIRSFMDTVSHNAAGNEITLVKRVNSER